VAVRTIFLMAEECARGERQGWGEFVRDYAGIGRSLLQQYFPALAPEMEAHVPAVFERARAADSAWFRGLKFSNEREFLMSFRELVFAYGREVARLPAPEISLDQMRQVMQELTVVEREMLWLYVKGYSAPQIAPMLMNQAATAEAVKKVADERLQQVLPGASKDAFNVSARVLIEAAEKAGSDSCLALKTMNNIINGQISWRERELAEEHIKECFYCIDRYTSFNEMIRLRKDVQPLPPEQTEALLGRLELPPAKGKGLLGRLFARG
jgi:hypothetical protein